MRGEGILESGCHSGEHPLASGHTPSEDCGPVRRASPPMISESSQGRKGPGSLSAVGRRKTMTIGHGGYR